MPKVGDRIVIEGTKLGQGRREGDVLETIGSLMKIRWTDGSESLLTPGAGTVSVVTGRVRRLGAAKPGSKAKATANKAKSAKPSAAAKQGKKPSATAKQGKKPSAAAKKGKKKR